MKTPTQTLEGYPLKDIIWKEKENIWVGLVQDPTANPDLRDGYRACTWRKNGSLTEKFGGKSRTDLYLIL